MCLKLIIFNIFDDEYESFSEDCRDGSICSPWSTDDTFVSMYLKEGRLLLLVIGDVRTEAEKKCVFQGHSRKAIKAMMKRFLNYWESHSPNQSQNQGDAMMKEIRDYWKLCETMLNHYSKKNLDESRHSFIWWWLPEITRDRASKKSNYSIAVRNSWKT